MKPADRAGFFLRTVATMRRALALIPVLAMLLTGCSPLKLLSAVSPSGHYERVADLRYGDHRRQIVDVYTPLAAHDDVPLVVYFYGGGWTDGHKEEFEFVASSLTRAGFVVAIPDYQLYPDVVFPTFVEDGAAAVAWALENAGRFGATSNRTYLMGHSAGAQIAALLAIDRRYLQSEGADPNAIVGLLGLSGPYDFLPLTEDNYLQQLFPEPVRDASQAIRFVTADAPPTLLIHGGDDDIVEPGNILRLAARLESVDVPVTLKNYAGVGHGRIVVALAPPLDFIASTLEDCIAFIQLQEAT